MATEWQGHDGTRERAQGAVRNLDHCYSSYGLYYGEGSNAKEEQAVLLAVLPDAVAYH